MQASLSFFILNQTLSVECIYAFISNRGQSIPFFSRFVQVVCNTTLHFIFHFSFFTFHSSLFTQKPFRSRCLNILFDIQPKRHKKIDDKWGAKRDKGEVYKIQPDACRIDPHPFTELLANAESRFFQEMPVAFKKIFDVVE